MGFISDLFPGLTSCKANIMIEWITSNDTTLRLSAFIILFVLLAVVESVKPKRNLVQPRYYRWLNNLGLVSLNNLVLKLVMPLFAIDAAIYAQQQQIGLFNWLSNASEDNILIILLAIIILDCLIYWQHRLFHQLPWLWRLHSMHHSDLDLDVSSAIRFHPIEIILSLAIKIAAVYLLGVPVVAIILFELLLNLTAMFSHSNIALPLNLDTLIRNCFVTPDMHRVHHSIKGRETNSNYGFCLSFWDRIFNSYKAQPDAGHLDMVIGLPYFRDANEYQLQNMLTQPFRSKIFGTLKTNSEQKK